MKLAKSKKGIFGTRDTTPPEKKFNGPLFPNRVKLWSKTSDLVFVCTKVLVYRIWAKSETWPPPPQSQPGWTFYKFGSTTFQCEMIVISIKVMYRVTNTYSISVKLKTDFFARIFFVSMY